MWTRSAVCAAGLLTLVTACGRSLEDVCLQLHAGEPLADAAARLDRTGALHATGSPVTSPAEEQWRKDDTFWLGTSFCYVTVDARGSVDSARFHYGN